MTKKRTRAKKRRRLCLAGVIECDITEKKFVEQFDEWLLSKGWKFGGVHAPDGAVIYIDSHKIGLR